MEVYSLYYQSKCLLGSVTPNLTGVWELRGLPGGGTLCPPSVKSIKMTQILQKKPNILNMSKINHNKLEIKMEVSKFYPNIFGQNNTKMLSMLEYFQ